MVKANINIRPHCKEILKNLSKKHELILFTGSHLNYVKAVLKKIDPDNKYFQAII